MASTRVSKTCPWHHKQCSKELCNGLPHIHPFGHLLKESNNISCHGCTTRPVQNAVTKAHHDMLTTEIIYRALGDVFSQKIEGAKQVDLRRSAMTSVYGAAFIGEIMRSMGAVLQ